MRALIVALSLAGRALAAPPDLDPARWEQLVEAERRAFALPDRHDRDHARGGDMWEVAGPDGGDCEDKALFARALLIARGWPPETLRLALVWTETRAYHAVLTVDVARDGQPATYVIDSRFPWVVPWNALTRFGYRWDRRQAATGGGWTRVAVTP